MRWQDEVGFSYNYPHQHEGALLIVGTAWTMQEDFERARQLRPKAMVMGINRTAQFIKCDFLFSIDRENIGHWRELQETSFGKGHFSYHSFEPTGNKTVWDYPGVDYWWEKNEGNGTSAWGAAKIAARMGFDDLILCGVPLMPGPYTDGEPAPTFDDQRNIDNMRLKIETDEYMHGIVSGMSGWTREFFGEPMEL